MADKLPLYGCLILVVEDEPLVGLDVTMSLEQAGADVLGPFPTSAKALEAIGALATGLSLNSAVLDVNLGDHTCEAVAKKLATLSIPFVFHTGNIPVDGQVIMGIDAPIVSKPSQSEILVACVAGCLCKEA
ncbi:response regulator [Roseovarius arcticus]|uniref:response regulator n=1 Tax=Roseovarius arcticus TaxID=2547404 RepID=UPI0011107A28|nr:response regulator [Roseovarius arcticus]